MFRWWRMTDLLGYTAAILATVAFVPQVTKTVRSRKTDDISVGMYILFCSGVALWLVYGLLVASGPLILSSFATLMLAGTVLVIKLKAGRSERKFMKP